MPPISVLNLSGTHSPPASSPPPHPPPDRVGGVILTPDAGALILPDAGILTKEEAARRETLN